jgi:general secretion pathway protein D
LVTRSFYLGSSDAKQTLNMIRSLVKTRDVFIDELNLLIMRDTPAAVRYAEKLVLAQDLAEPEVMLEVEVLEVSRTRLQELGVRFPDQVRFGPLGVDGATAPSQFEFSSSQLQAVVTNPAFVVNLKLQDGTSNVLANPRIRVRNREKARIHIGEKVPVVTTTDRAWI